MESIEKIRDSVLLAVPGATVDVVYTPAMNDWQGIRSIQLELKDVKCGS